MTASTRLSFQVTDTGLLALSVVDVDSVAAAVSAGDSSSVVLDP